MPKYYKNSAFLDFIDFITGGDQNDARIFVVSTFIIWFATALFGPILLAIFGWVLTNAGFATFATWTLRAAIIIAIVGWFRIRREARNSEDEAC